MDHNVQQFNLRNYKIIWRAEAIQKTPSIKQKQQQTQIDSKHTQVM